jgi:hypothetical protein
VNALSNKGGQELHLTQSELAWDNKVQQWAQKHESCLLFGVLGSVSRLMELIYALAGYVAVAPRNEVLGIPTNLGPPAMNTRDATPRKDQAQAADEGKSKKVENGKGKMIEPEKPKKVIYPIQTGGTFKIHERNASTPPASLMVPSTKKNLVVQRKKIEIPPRMARVLKLADKEDESEAEKPVKAVLETTPWSRFLPRSQTCR